MADIIHKLGIKANISKVYNALSTIEGLAGWWTKDTLGTSTVGSTIEFRFRTPEGKIQGGMDMDVVTLDSNKKVHWRCKTGPKDWMGTELTFNLSQDGEYTLVLFGHKNWQEATEFTAHCSMKWATFLLSLKEFIETGKGKPAPNDLKIDNWN